MSFFRSLGGTTGLASLRLLGLLLLQGFGIAFPALLGGEAIIFTLGFLVALSRSCPLAVLLSLIASRHLSCSLKRSSFSFAFLFLLPCLGHTVLTLLCAKAMSAFTHQEDELWDTHTHTDTESGFPNSNVTTRTPAMLLLLLLHTNPRNGTGMEPKTLQ